MFAGELDRAAEQVVQSGRIGASVDAKALWHLDTLSGDLAVLSGRPQGAFEHYARSLEAAQARGDHLQVFHDLEGVAAAGERVGAAAAADLKARGRAAPAGNRVMVACHLARARQPA
jgi:hypothetical protein